MDYLLLLKVFDGVSCVYHLAGIVTINSGKSKVLQNVNVESTKNVVQACFEKGIKRLVCTSSIYAFAGLPHGQTLVNTKELICESGAFFARGDQDVSYNPVIRP
jgi:nucleoside-diphosphate-sugar epimerase